LRHCSAPHGFFKSPIHPTAVSGIYDFEISPTFAISLFVCAVDFRSQVFANLMIGTTPPHPLRAFAAIDAWLPYCSSALGTWGGISDFCWIMH